LLTDEIKKTIAGYADGMSRPVSIVLNSGNHEKRAELIEFIKSVANTTRLIEFHEREFAEKLRSPLTFAIEVGGKPTGIYFSGIPTGHEFNTFILAILQSGGVEIKLEENLKKIITNIQEPLSFETFVSLTCHNCPEVVQALNQFAILNDNITSEMIDGGLFQDIIDERDIQGVPSVYLNGELFANGRVEVSALIEKIGEFGTSREPGSSSSIPIQDVVVVGGGPAGISSTIYAARKGFKVAVVTKNVGGQLRETLGIENFISVPSTTGSELTDALKQHMSDYAITLKEHVGVERVEPGILKNVILSSGEIIRSRTIIIATGANWKKLGIPGEQENIGNGVAYCPHCDGPFYKGKDVAVIGGGNSGVEAALDLAGIAKTVTLFEYLPTLKADQILLDQLEKRPNINIVTNAQTNNILSERGKVVGLKYEERDTKELIECQVSGIFVQIGLVPNSKIVDGLVDLNEYGEIVVDELCNTSIEGIYACGDVTTVPYKQIIMSMGEGSKAAITASDYLLKNPVDEKLYSLV
tara:strand:- start:36911 stop:38491 length:1581 start_codon:yes stop_codon:yes gene_type:complete